MNPRHKWARMCAALALALSALGCTSVDPIYVTADQATYDAVAPVYLAYTNADPLLDQAKKDRRLRLIESWQERINSTRRK